MSEQVDPKHLPALLGSAGKTIAALPGAQRLVARMREASSPEDLRDFLQSVDLGLDEPARHVVQQAASDRETWREAHAALVRSAEQHLHERFSPSA